MHRAFTCAYKLCKRKGFSVHCCLTVHNHAITVWIHNYEFLRPGHSRRPILYASLLCALCRQCCRVIICKQWLGGGGSPNFEFTPAPPPPQKKKKNIYIYIYIFFFCWSISTLMSTHSAARGPFVLLVTVLVCSDGKRAYNIFLVQFSLLSASQVPPTPSALFTNKGKH